MTMRESFSAIRIRPMESSSNAHPDHKSQTTCQRRAALPARLLACVLADVLRAGSRVCRRRVGWRKLNRAALQPRPCARTRPHPATPHPVGGGHLAVLRDALRRKRLEGRIEQLGEHARDARPAHEEGRVAPVQGAARMERRLDLLGRRHRAHDQLVGKRPVGGAREHVRPSDSARKRHRHAHRDLRRAVDLLHYRCERAEQRALRGEYRHLQRERRTLHRGGRAPL